ncbi:pyridoxal phosphate-dependent aminotransferase family protein [Massilia sp. H6]|uniref:aminotransferase class I/II-fold pyridoxal phosphate-dependent enzyme n=1 Tax=Massilia sp. H6 TaxID=2970464 RepID=UPI00216943B8|nr:pyridoxal phosphate-dependent aminotransferase family protein [Massilia sp. H6]UVW27470.1 pyridoxal phosphate-dependent aminotransferase family protein [Massilia sp. H6]
MHITTTRETRCANAAAPLPPALDPVDPVKMSALPARACSEALSGSAALYRQPRGADLLRRSAPLEAWCALRIRHGLWPYCRTLEGPPTAQAMVAGDGGPAAHGINFASQDYLSLAAHPAVRDAAVRTLLECGPHSAGSASLLVNSRHSQALECALGELLRCQHVVLFPTGWDAAFGAITALVHGADHVVIDALAHAALRQGAAAATRKVAAYRHLDCDHVRELLAGIRAVDTTGAILVVTEGLFGMDADSPDLPLMQYLCRAYGATLLVDVAHDLGAMGPGGGGVIAAQGMQGKIDLVMGTFSKTFASDGGFVACAQQGVRRQLQLFAGPDMCSSALSPVQAATVLACLRIVASAEGDALRAELLRNAVELRALLAGEGVACMGEPAPIVPVWTGLESATRIAGMLLAREQVFVNPIEFPGVPLGAARLRLQLMARHTPGQIRRGARLLVAAVQRAGAAPWPERRRMHPV